MATAKDIFLTKDGLLELTKELEKLTKVKRPKVIERLSAARNLGDLAENSDYAAAREELSFIDGRIEELELLLRNAKLIRGRTTIGGRRVQSQVKLGSKVTVSVNGKKEVFTLVGEWEADPTEKKISHDSPLGRALIGKTVGEKVHVEAPAGKILYAIIAVK